MYSSAWPELRLEVQRCEKEIDDSRLLVPLLWPGVTGRRVWGKRAGYLQVMGHQHGTYCRVSAGFPLSLTRSYMFSNSSPKRGQLCVEIGPPEQTASRGGIGENVEVLGETVEG